MTQFKIKDYPFGALAQMYYPDHNYDSALRLFRREMHDTRGMWEAMQDVGYKEKMSILQSEIKQLLKEEEESRKAVIDVFKSLGYEL